MLRAYLFGILTIVGVLSAQLKAEDDWGTYNYVNGCPEVCQQPCLNSCGGLKVFGKFLYWKAVQDQTPFAGVLPGGIQPIIADFSDTPVVVDEKFNIVDQNFKFKPGFQVGLGYEMPQSAWDFKIAWTNLNETINSSVTDADGGVIPLMFPLGIIFGFINKDPTSFAFGTDAQSRWKFDFNVLDFEIGRTFYSCDCLGIRPFVGIRAASINQKQKISYLGFSTAMGILDLMVFKKNNFRGIGPSLGFDASWEIFPQVSLYGGLSGALLYGKFDVHDQPLAMLEDNSITVDMKLSKQCRLRPTVDFSVGLDWHTCVYEGIYFLVGAAYETQYWWNQWQVPSSVVGSLVTGSTSPEGDLFMQGLTLKAAILF